MCTCMRTHSSVGSYYLLSFVASPVRNMLCNFSRVNELFYLMSFDISVFRCRDCTTISLLFQNIFKYEVLQSNYFRSALKC